MDAGCVAVDVVDVVARPSLVELAEQGTDALMNGLERALPGVQSPAVAAFNSSI
jgi:hypothetical protein